MPSISIRRTIVRTARRAAALAAAFAAASALLGGCARTITICPLAVILEPTSSMTVFKPGASTDPSNELYSLTLVNAQTSCTYEKGSGTTSSDLKLTFHATRPPSALAASYSATYFMVVSENAKLYDKKLHTLQFTFAPGAVSATITQRIDDVTIKLANGKLPWNYQLMSGLQLTKEQMAYNEKMRGYLP
jgi:hypothetical protein